MNFLRNHRVIYKVLLYYLLIFLIPLCVIIYIYTDVYNNTLDNAYDNQLSLLEKSSTILNFNFDSISDVAHQINTNQYVNQFLQADSPTNDNSVIADIYKLQPMVTSYLTTNNFISEVQIYSQKAKSMITSKTSYINMKSLYVDKYNDTFANVEQLEDEFLNMSYKPSYIYNFDISISNREGRSLVYTQSMTRSGANKKANMYIYINQDKLMDVLENSDNKDKESMSFSLIGDSAGNVITRSDNFNMQYYPQIIERCTQRQGYFIHKLANENMVIAYEKADRLDGYYITAVSKKSILASIKNIQMLYITIVGITIVVGAFLVILFAYKTSTPIISLAQLLEKNKIIDKVKYSDKFINGEVLKVIKSNTLLKEKVVQQIPAIRISLWYKLLNKNVEDINTLIYEFEQAGVNFNGTYYAVLIVSMSGIDANSKVDEISAYRVILNDHIKKNVLGIIGTYDIDLEDEAIILSTKFSSYVDWIFQLEQSIPKICQYVQRQFNMNVSFSGSVTDKVKNIYKCYNEAKNAKSHSDNINQMNILWYNKAKRTDSSYIYYPIDVETELIEGIIQGNTHVCQTILSQILKNNFKHGTMDHNTGIQLLSSLAATIYRCTENIKIENYSSVYHDIEGLSSYVREVVSIQVGFEYIKNIVVEICQTKDISANTDNLTTRVKKFVQDNYANNQLSLSFVAEKFSITEIYLSRFFKEKIGENFSKYIEKLRMEKAKELIENTNDRVKLISEKVGYNSPQVFRRVYKKYYGELPSKHLLENNDKN